MLLEVTEKCSVVADVMFRQDTTSEFQHMVDRVYKETSRHLLDVLNNKYKFLEHLKVRHDSPQHLNTGVVHILWLMNFNSLRIYYLINLFLLLS